jgi:hypothetical protein
VLYLGLMYHISKPMELMEKISEVNDDILVVDTTLSRARGSFLKIVPQDPDSYMSAVDRPIAMRPTKQAVRDLAEHFGYSVVTLEPDFRNVKGEPAWTGGRLPDGIAQGLRLREENRPRPPGGRGGARRALRTPKPKAATSGKRRGGRSDTLAEAHGQRTLAAVPLAEMEAGERARGRLAAAARLPGSVAGGPAAGAEGRVPPVTAAIGPRRFFWEGLEAKIGNKVNLGKRLRPWKVGQ